MKSWKDISLAKALKLIRINGEGKDTLDLIIEQMAILKDKSTYEIELMNPTELIAEANKLTWLNKLPKEKLTKVIKVNGREYGITNLERICLAQMIDIESYYEQGLNENIEKILSVLYLPIKKRIPLTNSYTLHEYEPNAEREADMLDMDMETMWGTTLFFYRGVKAYSNAMTDYLEKQKEKRKIELEVMRLTTMIQKDEPTET